MLGSLDDFVALASAALLAAFGLGLLLVRPVRREQAFFGAFAVLWALQVATAYAGTALGSVELHARGLLASYALIPPLALFLVHFSTLGSKGRRFAWLSALFALVAVAAAATLALAPDSVVRVEEQDGEPAVAIGPAALPLFVAPLYGAFYVALAAFVAQARAATREPTRRRLAGFVAAIALFASYGTMRNLLVFLSLPANTSAQGASASALAAFFAAGALAIAALAWAALGVRAPGERANRLLLAAFAVPALVALAEGAAGLLGASLYSFGLWRILTVAALAHAIVRYRLFDIDLKLKRGLARSTVAAAFLAVFFVVSESAATFFTGAMGTVVGLGAAGLLVFVVAPLQRVAERFANTAMPNVAPTQEYLAYRKLQVYHAALESALRDDELTERERRMLDRLRAELGISAEDAEAMEQDVRGGTPQPSYTRAT